MNNYKIRLKLKSFDPKLLDHAVSEIVGTLNRVEADFVGPVPLPNRIERFTVNKSPHVYKESREQFEIRTHSRLLIVTSSPQIIEALRGMDLSSGVDVELKLHGDK